MERWYRLFTQILGCLGLIFLSITLFTPYWVWLANPKLNITMGLWSVCAKNVCTKLKVESGIFIIFRILMTVIVLIGVMAVATSFVPSFRRYQLPVITNVSTGLLSLIIMLIFNLFVCNRLLFDGLGFPQVAILSWSFLIECLGCSMFLLCGFLHVLIEVERASRIHPKSILMEAKVKNVIWALPEKALPEKATDEETSSWE